MEDIENKTLFAPSPDDLSSLVDELIDGIIWLDINLNVISANHAFVKLSGYHEHQLIGKELNTLFKDDLSSVRNQATEQRQTFGPCNLINKDGYEIATVASFLRLNHHRDTIIIIVHNMSDLRELQDKVRKYKDRLEWAHFETRQAHNEAKQANQQKTLFLANLSHEIRTPLNGIIGMTELLMNTEINNKQSHYLACVYEAGEHLLAIINDVLDLSKIEAGEMPISQTQCSIHHIIDNMKTIFGPKIEAKNLQLNIHPLEKDLHVITDPVRIKQILVNLLGNALKFTESGSITLSTSCIPCPSDNNKMLVTFEVTDTGVGIAADALGTIFQKFTQAHFDAPQSFGGTGLGLAICKKLCLLMDGNIDVKSQENKGSTFSFTLPLMINHEPKT
mgnify:CR=1 FL=1